MMRYFIAVGILLAFCGRAAAFGTTEDVAKVCSGVDPGAHDEPLTSAEMDFQCLYYMKGFLDAIRADRRNFKRGIPPMICASEEVHSTHAAMTFLNWVAANQGEMKRAAYATLYVALARAYPCLR